MIVENVGSIIIIIVVVVAEEQEGNLRKKSHKSETLCHETYDVNYYSFLSSNYYLTILDLLSFICSTDLDLLSSSRSIVFYISSFICLSIFFFVVLFDKQFSLIYYSFFYVFKYLLHYCLFVQLYS